MLLGKENRMKFGFQVVSWQTEFGFIDEKMFLNCVTWARIYPRVKEPGFWRRHGEKDSTTNTRFWIISHISQEKGNNL